MDNPLLSVEIQEFITKNSETDVTKLALQKNNFPAIEWSSVLNQIAAKQKAKAKLPTWFKTANILYPSKISVEQTSSEKTAHYKASLVSGKNLIDLSGGFGVDDFYFAQKVKQLIHCEINAELSEIVNHNFKQLDVTNVECLAGNSSEILASITNQFDWIYIDPSRRNDAKGKVFMLKDCLPNVPENLNLYFEKTNNILIKTAPLLDISAGLSELNNVKEIHVVALEGEVKELLWVLEKNYRQGLKITTVNLVKDQMEHFSFDFEQTYTAQYSAPQKYLYEPNAAIMKSGGFEVVSDAFGINKLQQHSHLYTSENLIEFPGRTFEIQNVIGYSKTEMKHYLENSKANITTRNFPDTVESIRKKWKIKDGGEWYCFFTTDVNNNKIVLLCSKIK